jgi:aryl carrier-like protein
MSYGCRRVAVALLCAIMSVAPGCSRKTDPVDEAKAFVQQAISQDEKAGRLAGLDSERYLPVQERLKRRQERLGAAMANRMPTVDARQP